MVLIWEITLQAKPESLTGNFGTEITLMPTSQLAASTTYFLRVVSGVGGTNEGGQGLGSTVYFNSFTTGT